MSVPEKNKTGGRALCEEWGGEDAVALPSARLR